MSETRRFYFLTARASDGRICAGCVQALSLIGACAVFKARVVKEGHATAREFETELIRLTHAAEEPEGLPAPREHIYCTSGHTTAPVKLRAPLGAAAAPAPPLPHAD